MLQQQDGIWCLKGKCLMYTCSLDSDVLCTSFTKPETTAMFGLAGPEQGVSGRVFEMHGQHVLCIRWCMPAAQLPQHGSTGGFVPAHQPKDSGELSTSTAIRTKFCLQTLFSQAVMQTWCLSAGASLSADSCSGFSHTSLQVTCVCKLARLAGLV